MLAGSKWIRAGELLLSLRSDNRFVFEPLPVMTSLGESPVLKEQSNWDVICDVGTFIKQANVMPNFAIVYSNNG